MWPYLATTVSIAAVAVVTRRRTPDAAAWLFCFIFLTIFVGLRHKVGMDWNNYLRMIEKAANAETFQQLFAICEPLYALFLYVGHNSGFGMYAVNLISALIFFAGLFKFARYCPSPWLALTAAMPFYVVVVAMSANRQAIAAGILMYLVAVWQKCSLLKRTLIILLAAGFHISAVIYLVFAGLDLKLRLWMKVVLVTVLGLLAIYILQTTGRVEFYDSAYGRGQTELTQSSGAIFHVMINGGPALLYFLLPKYRAKLFPTILLRRMAFAALACVPLVLFASVAAGRLSLYWYPVSLWVWSALPEVFSERSRPVVRIFTALFMVLMLTFWLLLGNAAHAHIPYKNAIFMDFWQLHIGALY